MSVSKLSKITKNELIKIINTSFSFQEVLEKIGYTQVNDNRIINSLRGRCEKEQIDYSHLEKVYFYNKDYIKCTKCQQMKPLSDFYISNNKISHVCKECTREKQREKYHKKQNQLNEYKATKKCQKCGIDKFYLLEFHHMDPSKKDFTIGDNPNIKWESLQLELEKCIVLCANCHREFHYLNNNFNMTLKEYLQK